MTSKTLLSVARRRQAQKLLAGVHARVQIIPDLEVATTRAADGFFLLAAQFFLQ